MCSVLRATDNAATIAQVRRFTRTGTQRVGALQDRFLARDRPLGAARVRIVRLTDADHSERRALDEHSDQAATTLLDPLTPTRRRRRHATPARSSST